MNSVNMMCKKTMVPKKRKRRKIDIIKAQMKKQFASFLLDEWSEAVCPESPDDILLDTIKAGGSKDISRVFGNIYISNQYTAQNIPELIRRNIKLVVCLIADLGGFDYSKYKQHGIKFVHINIQDNVSVNISQYFDELNSLIDQYVAEGKPILIHCYAGVSRSTTIVVSYLMYKHSHTYTSALETIREKRSFVQPNFGFIEQLENYYEQLHEV